MIIGKVVADSSAGEDVAAVADADDEGNGDDDDDDDDNSGDDDDGYDATRIRFDAFIRCWSGIRVVIKEFHVAHLRLRIPDALALLNGAPGSSTLDCDTADRNKVIAH